MLNLPLWIVTEHIQLSNPEHALQNEPGTALLFTHVEKLFAFKKANRGGEWKFGVAEDREGLIVLVADAHRLNIRSLTVDPSIDGTGGEQISLGDLVTFKASIW